MLAQVALQHAEAFGEYLRMARPINLVPSALLVFVGAWVRTYDDAMAARYDFVQIVMQEFPVPMLQAGTGHSVQLLGNGRVWLVSLMSAGVAAASCIANDYFDFISGNDVTNAPAKVCSCSINVVCPCGLWCSSRCCSRYCVLRSRCQVAWSFRTEHCCSAPSYISRSSQQRV